MLAMLVAYDTAGNVVATLDHLVARGVGGNVTGLIDFAAHEEAGGELLDIWNVQGAVGSKVWPEWLGGRAHDFRVEKDGPPGAKRISALVHKTSGYRRERSDVISAINARVAEANGKPADIRDLVGGPDRPLRLDDEGRTVGRTIITGTPKHLPVIGADLVASRGSIAGSQ